MTRPRSLDMRRWVWRPRARAWVRMRSSRVNSRSRMSTRGLKYISSPFAVTTLPCAEVSDSPSASGVATRMSRAWKRGSVSQALGRSAVCMGVIVKAGAYEQISSPCIRMPLSFCSLERTRSKWYLGQRRKASRVESGSDVCGASLSTVERQSLCSSWAMGCVAG